MVTGATGLVGSTLCKKLQKKGYNVYRLSRRKSKNTFYWNPSKNEIDSKAIKNTDVIIHLAGANIAEKRWTDSQKQRIINSRTKTAVLLHSELTRQKKKLDVFISASAIGYYGMVTSDKIFTEDSPLGNDFLAETCNLWEKSAEKFSDISNRVVKLRTGIVLTPKGGALAKMATPFKWGLGAVIGSGKQYMPWIHIDDLCEMYCQAIENPSLKGSYNAVAPSHTTNAHFSKILASVLKKPFWLPNIPAFVLRLALGQMASMLLKGSRISSKKIEQTGFVFKHRNLKQVLQNLLANHR